MIAVLIAMFLAPSEASAPPSDVGGLVTQPVWLTLPTGADMARFRPEGATASGRAVIECKVSGRGLLDSCQVLEETAGEHYGKAALRVAARFRMGPRDRAGLATAGRKVRLPLTWTLTPPPTDTADTSSSPHWIRRPSGNDMARVYPRVAVSANASGRATMVCRILATGRLTDCDVVEETPPGMGFGEATIRLAPYFQMSTTTADGKSVEGGTIRVPLIWRLH